MTGGAGFLWYVYPTETALLIQTTLGVSSYTAAVIIFGLMLLSGGGCLATFCIINVKDYYRTHPRKTKAIVSLSFRVIMAISGAMIAIGYTSLAVVMGIYYQAMTNFGVVFFGTLIFSAF